MSYQPKCVPEKEWREGPMRRLLERIKHIERNDIDISREEWLKLAKQYVRYKWELLGVHQHGPRRPPPMFIDH